MESGGCVIKIENKIHTYIYINQKLTDILEILYAIVRYYCKNEKYILFYYFNTYIHTYV